MDKILKNQIIPHLPAKCTAGLTAFLMTGLMNASAQIDTVNVSSDVPPVEGNLNNAVEAAISSGKLSSTVFKLNLDSRYIINRTITVPAGERLTIDAQEPGKTQDKAPPQIVWTSASSVSKTFLIAVYGDLVMKNIWVLFADMAGVRTGSPIVFDGDTTGLSGDSGEYGTFENCIFDYMPCPIVTASGVICVRSKHFNGVFRNCYFRNCTDRHFMYYGRAVSFPFDVTGFHTDSITFENCTFANIGYVYQQESGNYADNVHFNHCTFLNVVMHSLESGWWYKASVTNSIWVNAYMRGEVPAHSASNGDPNGGTIRIDSVATFGFAVPFTEEERRILFAHNSYFMEDWVVCWMANNKWAQYIRNAGQEDQIPVPQPMLSPKTLAFFESGLFPYMNAVNLYDSTEPGFLVAPTDTSAIKEFLDFKWWSSSDTDWAWHPELSTQYRWPLSENLSYTNDTLLCAAMGGFPLGDLYRWFPERYAQWKTQAETENARISGWLNTGRDTMMTAIQQQPGPAVPSRFVLFQNHPNPFNPATRIKYSIPQGGAVSLKVYNLLGEEIATLFEGVRQAGDHVALFDGRSVAGGVYFVRLKAGHFSETKKMVLLK